MTALLNVLAFLFMLVILVFVHELGHFLIALRMGIRVEEFGIGYPPRALILFERNGVKYTLNWLPLGGFVRFGGEDNSLYGVGSLAAAPPWRKIPVMVAGPLMNLVLAMLIFGCIFAINGVPTPTDNQLITEVYSGGPAQAGGFNKGDVLISLNGQPVADRNSISTIAGQNLNQPVPAVVERDGKQLKLTVTPGPWVTPRGEQRAVGLGISYMPAFRQEIRAVDASSAAAAAGFKQGDVLLSLNGLSVWSQSQISSTLSLNLGQPIGAVVEREGQQITLTIPTGQQRADLESLGIKLDVNHEYVNMLTALWLGVTTSFNALGQMLSYFSDLIGGLFSGGQQQQQGGLAGPIGIARVTGEVIEQGGLPAFWRLMAFLSLNLFLLNLLPIPALDGSHIMFSLIEWVRGGKKVPPEKEALVHAIGFATLMALMLVVSISDILNAINGRSVLGGG